MKIAIMTQPLGANYGGIMQAWALQQILKRMGHEVVTIDRQPDKPSMAYKASRFAYRSAMKIAGKRKAPINFEKYLPFILRNTRNFIEQNISMSEPLYSTQQLRDHFDRENYDAVIVGSDQTWRPKYSPNIYNFFLDFIEDKDILKIAYATSFGVDEWEFTEEQTKRCAELARKFNIISVREDSGVTLCKKYFGVEAKHVLDPTFLLDEKDYQSLIGEERLKGVKSSIYTYLLDKSPGKEAVANLMCKETGEYVSSCRSEYSIGEDFAEVDRFVMPNVKDWMGGFANAKYVLTDSFHGMVFSIVFNKPFFVLVNKDRGASRFHSLLGVLGLQDRMVDSLTENLNIDEKLNIKIKKSARNGLDAWKSKSFCFLESNLKNKYMK